MAARFISTPRSRPDFVICRDTRASGQELWTPEESCFIDTVLDATGVTEFESRFAIQLRRIDENENENEIHGC